MGEFTLSHSASRGRRPDAGTAGLKSDICRDRRGPQMVDQGGTCISCNRLEPEWCSPCSVRSLLSAIPTGRPPFVFSPWTGVKFVSCLPGANGPLSTQK